MKSIFSSHVVHSFRSLRSLISRRSLLPLTAFAPRVHSARSISRIDELNSRATGAHPGTPGTDITHKSVLNITPSVKMEHNIMSNIGARNAGVCIFV
jgi:hypothetical protein